MGLLDSMINNGIFLLVMAVIYEVTGTTPTVIGMATAGAFIVVFWIVAKGLGYGN